MDALTEAVVVPATTQQLDAIHAALDRFWAGVAGVATRPPDTIWQFQFATAIAEIAANIVRHAYANGNLPGAMQLYLRAYPDRAEAHFSDQGLPFVPPTPIANGPDADLQALPESGRGLMIARACLDELTYQRTSQGTNEWRLVKRFSG